MSRRFGRNQRRRAREQIAHEQQQSAALRVALEMDTAMLCLQSKKLREAEDYARQVASIVGREAVIAGEPTNLDARFQGKDHYKVVRRVEPELIAFGGTVPDVVEMRYETLRLLRIKKISDNVSMQIHMYVSLADKTSAYCISERALANMPPDMLVDFLRERIADQMATLLVRELRPEEF